MFFALVKLLLLSVEVTVALLFLHVPSLCENVQLLINDVNRVLYSS